jgi:threonine/homoserine/homoserine lactone efflux protein
MSPATLFSSFAAGLVCGFVVSIPVGPVNLTVINTALQRGFLRAFLVGLGAITAETIYAYLLLAGHSTILDWPVASFVLRVVAVAVIAVVGVRALFFKEERAEVADAATIQRVDERWHHPRAFMLGFFLTISNLMLVVLWATLAAVLFAKDWVLPELPSRVVCTAGVLTGGALWFFLIAYFVARAHRRVKPQVLTVLVRSCGVVFLVSAALLAYKLFTNHH